MTLLDLIKNLNKLIERRYYHLTEPEIALLVKLKEHISQNIRTNQPDYIELLSELVDCIEWHLREGMITDAKTIINENVLSCIEKTTLQIYAW